MIFNRQAEVETICKITKTPILCTCHHEPVKYEKKRLDKYIKENGHNPWCDVCMAIDKCWSGGYKDLLDVWKNKSAEMERAGDLETSPSTKSRTCSSQNYCNNSLGLLQNTEILQIDM